MSHHETLTLDRLTAAVRLHEVAEDMSGEPFRLRGKEWIGRCTFHDDRRPSLAVNDDKGVYHCWSCGASGNTVQYVRRAGNCSFREAVAYLLRFAGLEGGAGVALPSMKDIRARETERRLERERQQQRMSALWPLSAALRRNRQQQLRALKEEARTADYLARLAPLMERRRQLMDDMLELTGSYECPELW